MCDVRERKLGAILGSFVADAAAQPLHWNYDLQKLDQILGSRDDVEFWHPSANPYYCIETGRHSCYGDQAYVILKSLVVNKGIDLDDISKRTFHYFGPDSEYENKLVDAYTYKAGVQKSYPIKGPWRHTTIKNFIKKYSAGLDETGSEDNVDMDCVTKVTVVVALYAGCQDMLHRVEEVIRLTHAYDVAVAVGLTAARLIEHYILYGERENAIQTIIDQLCDRTRNNPQDLDRAMAAYLRQVLENSHMSNREAATQNFRND